MPLLAEYESNPVGSLLTLPLEARMEFFDALLRLPDDLRNVLFSPKTGAYIRGLAKTAKLTTPQVSRLAFLVLHVGLNKLTLAEMPARLQQEFAIAPDVASMIARSLEKDIFSAVTLQLGQQRMAPAKNSTTPVSSGAPNVLDLKNQPPAPPPLPARR